MVIPVFFNIGHFQKFLFSLSTEPFIFNQINFFLIGSERIIPSNLVYKGIPLSLQLDGVNLSYFKLFNLKEFIF